MNHEQFTALASEGYNHIPLTRRILADLDTPLSAYLKVGQGPYSYLFESVHGGERWGRYSIIGRPARQLLRITGSEITVEVDGKITERHTSADPLAFIESFQARFKVPELDHPPRFHGGLVGYFGYDTIGYIEPRLRSGANPDPLGTPDILLMVSDELLVFDNLSGVIDLIVYVDPGRDDAFAEGHGRLSAMEAELARAPCPSTPRGPQRMVNEADFISGFAQTDFERAVMRIKDYIVAGDVMQVVLSQRMSIAYTAPPLDLYRALRCLNPSPYLYYLDLGEFQIAGSSPEILTRLEDGEATVRPIAGTRHRGQTVTEDRALEAELLADPKELAEHLMLIDLGRNDIGRIAVTGSVKLTENMIVERYSHVMHIVSNVTGRLKPELTTMDVLRATFPAGTLSGAPKIRAMEIIAELEPIKRGIYGGAIGYLSWNGNMDTAIAIRTAIIKDGQLHIQVGAGIVADSQPEMEWRETLAKGRAIFRAVALAEQGLNVDISPT